MKNWRPIALCNVVYKMVAKVLDNRLKGVPDKCISSSQYAFVPDRSILDNAIVAIEVIHYMKAKAKGTQGDVALKFDISKAYVRLDWEYLRDVMLQMGFSLRWVQWIMLCVETVDYTVLVNGAQVGPFVPGRGIRQGDPLSPYLFIICAEGLSALISDAERRGVLNGSRIFTGAPSISHLLFADDCFLFFRACEQEAMAMKNILNTYEVVSGQAINLQKFEMYCSRNTTTSCKERITQVLGVRQVLGTGKIPRPPINGWKEQKSDFQICEGSNME